jgi:hypothetical protein|tara:strand:+ start:3025 stop:3303 length:279 start_codon:yes stop_codon:yes gene_type:complete
MSSKDLIREYKEQLKSLGDEKQSLIRLTDEKDLRIKKLLIQLEQANDDVQTLGKKVHEVESQAKKKDSIKRIINQKIDEALHSEDKVVDNEE